MRLAIHDYPGFAFPIEAARFMADQGHEVLFVYSEGYVGGRGEVTAREGDGGRISFCGLSTSHTYSSTDLRQRAVHEIEYARALWGALGEFKPDLVLHSSGPLISLLTLGRRYPYVLWHQDVQSSAFGSLVSTKARLAQGLVTRAEISTCRRARRIIAISDKFLPLYRGWGLDMGKVDVIPNWASIRELGVWGPDNPWATDNLGQAAHRAVYAGTLGLKHRPEILADFAEEFGQLADGETIVVSEGRGADLLAASPPAASGRLRVMGFQDYGVLDQVIGSGTVAVALLEPSASEFSVPSKVTTYLACGRPVVGFLPADNPAATMIVEGGGWVFPPDPAFCREAAQQVADAITSGDLARRGQLARQTAEFNFDREKSLERIRSILEEAVT